VPQIAGREIDRRGTDVLFEAAELGSAGDWDNPWFLRQEPRQRDLRGGRALLATDLFQETDHGLVRLPGLRRKTRQGAAIVVAAEGRGLVDLAAEKAPAQRTVGDKADAQFLAGRQHLRFGLTLPEGVFALDSRDPLDRVRAANGLRSRFRKAEVLHLTLLNQVPQRSRHVLDRHVRVNPVLVEEVNRLDPEPLE